MGKGFGIAALILGIIGLILSLLIITTLFGLVLGILAIIFGLIGTSKDETKTLAIIGLIFGLIAVFVAVASIFIL